MKDRTFKWSWKQAPPLSRFVCNLGFQFLYENNEARLGWNTIWLHGKCYLKWNGWSDRKKCLLNHSLIFFNEFATLQCCISMKSGIAGDFEWVTKNIGEFIMPVGEDGPQRAAATTSNQFHGKLSPLRHLSIFSFTICFPQMFMLPLKLFRPSRSVVDKATSRLRVEPFLK